MKKPYLVAVGNACYDEYYRADSWVENGDKLLIRPIEKRAGGMIPNAASVMAALGAHTYFVSYMNDSVDSCALQHELTQNGLDTSHIITDNRLPDAKCIIVLTPTERTILVLDFPYPPRKIPLETQKMLCGAAYIYTTMAEMRRFEDALAQADAWRAGGAKLVFDIESSSFDNADDPLFACADVLCFNQSGFEKYTKGKNKKATVQQMLERGCVVSVTMGADGCECWRGNEYVRLSGWQVPVIDTTGAGDTFNAALVCKLMQNTSLQTAAEFANAAAARSTTVMGARSGAVDAATVEAFLEDKKG